MFIPLRTEVDAARRPVVTPWLIGVNVVVSLVLLAASRITDIDINPVLHLFALDPGAPWVWQYVTYAFLHDLSSPWHLLFNMVFLWVFGTAVEGRFGRWWFLAFYLAGAAVAGVAHGLFTSAPVIGASGAVAAVSGAFLALFPRAHIRVLMIFFIIGVVTIPAMWLIGLYIIIDVVSQLTSVFGHRDSNVAYVAHIAGYAFGFGLSLLLLATRVIPGRDFDVLHLFSQSRRRAAMRAAAAEAQRRLEAIRVDPGKQVARPVVTPPPPPPHAEERATIARFLREGRLAEAADLYRELLIIDPGVVLPEEQQLDVANQLMHAGYDEPAATAYERYLDRYPTGARIDEVRLMLAMIYTRRLHRPDRAKALLDRLRRTALASDLVAFADRLRAELPA